MKKLIFAALGMVLAITSAQSLNAVKLCAPFQDASTHERVVSNNPAVQLGAPTRDSNIYHTSWRAGRRRARWHDQHIRGQWRRGTQSRQRGNRSMQKRTYYGHTSS